MKDVIDFIDIRVDEIKKELFRCCEIICSETYDKLGTYDVEKKIGMLLSFKEVKNMIAVIEKEKVEKAKEFDFSQL